ncbi:hypothetical protein B0H10DRAFT_2049125 [Mycena sp. CBHHK59/15]|nr:hypothetical protein B0H10DRAFT_2049125 [Mycena sp. CBHHK59/15]
MPMTVYLFFALLAITVAISGAAIAFYHHDGSQAQPEEWSNIRGFIPHLFDSYLSRARLTTDWKDIMVQYFA